MYKTKSFREKLMCVIGSTFLIFMFVDQLLLVDVFSQLYYLTRAKKTTMADFRYKSLKSWKIDPPALSSPGLLRGRIKDNDRARSADRAARFNAPFHCFRTSRTFLWSLKWNGRLFFVVMTTCSTSMTCFSFFWKSCPVQNNGRCIKMPRGDRLHTRCQNYESAY